MDKTENFGSDLRPAAQTSAPQQKVYFSGGFWGHEGRERAGTPLALEKRFDALGRQWFVPSAYLCGKGVVLDLCMRVPPEEIRAFMGKWQLSPQNDSIDRFTHEEQMQLDAENPLCPDIVPKLTLGGKPLRLAHRCSVCLNPCLPAEYGDKAAKQAAAHYGLDPQDGWVIFRSSFLWAGKRRPSVKSLSLTLTEQPRSFFGAPFALRAAGDSATFESPLSGKTYTLRVKEFSRQSLPQAAFPSEQLLYPSNFVLMQYTLSPNTSEKIRIYDCAEPDRPRTLAPRDEPCAEHAENPASVGIIGGADGPMALFLTESGAQQGGVYTVCSAPHFAPILGAVTWRAVFRAETAASAPIALL